MDHPSGNVDHQSVEVVNRQGDEPGGKLQLKTTNELNRLHAAVNARYAYWLSARPIPGGVAFENFELRERFYDGQHFTFGITRKTPQDLGIHLSRDTKE